MPSRWFGAGSNGLGPGFSGAAGGGAPLGSVLLLSGDEQSGSDGLLLSGDEQIGGNDRLAIEEGA